MLCFFGFREIGFGVSNMITFFYFSLSLTHTHHTHSSSHSLSHFHPILLRKRNVNLIAEFCKVGSRTILNSNFNENGAQGNLADGKKLIGTEEKLIAAAAAAAFAQECLFQSQHTTVLHSDNYTSEPRFVRIIIIIRVVFFSDRKMQKNLIRKLTS